MKKHFKALCLSLFFLLSGFASMAMAQDESWLGKDVKWDSKSLIIDGKRQIPVMGEFHYSRLPADEWSTEVRRMKEGGVTMLACYVFWNHIEEESDVYRWEGQRNLRRFLEICKQECMPVILRLGPFCHGEVRCGGIPDWLLASGAKSRSEDPRFLAHVEDFYRQIFTQVQGLQWKDGGPVIAAQFDNEYRGRASYLLRLKQIALGIGFDLPFYTRTGWPALSTPVPFGELLPLYGDYADGFWDRSIGEGVGNYYQAFNFKAFRSSTAIATEQLGNQEARVADTDGQYPYFTCELGGGMAVAYHRRPYLYPEDAYSMALVKLGSGSNLLGYYMYHGGTNPEGKLSYLNECQATRATNYNDMPVLTYDFQAPLGEFGQTYPQFFMLRKLHLFMHDYADILAPMDATFPSKQDLKRGEDSGLRWSYRSSEDGQSGFVFVNNYERLCTLSAKTDVRFDVCGVKFPSRAMTIPSGCMAIFPVNVDGIRYATAQIVARRDGKIYMAKVDGVPVEIATTDGRVMRNVKPRGLARPVCQNIYLLDSADAEHLFLEEPTDLFTPINVTFTKTREASAQQRTIPMGANKVATEPADSDFAAAAVYEISLPADAPRAKSLLTINYRGDVARLYADGRLIEDNFYYGRPMQYAMWRLPQGCSKLELRILPQQADMPVYFPREATKAVGEQLIDVRIEPLR